MNDYSSDDEFENIYDDFDNDSSLNLSVKKKGKFYVNKNDVMRDSNQTFDKLTDKS